MANASAKPFHLQWLFWEKERPSLASYLFLFPFLFPSFTHGNKKEERPDRGEVKIDLKTNITACSRQIVHIPHIPGFSLWSRACQSAASSLRPFCLTHSPLWFSPCFLSFPFLGRILFPDLRSSYNCPPPPPERMSKASRPFEVGHCWLTLKGEGAGRRGVSGRANGKVSKFMDGGEDDDRERAVHASGV